MILFCSDISKSRLRPFTWYRCLDLPNFIFFLILLKKYFIFHNSNLYERIVVLEQSNIEKDKNIQQITAAKDQKIEQLNQMVNNLTLDLARTKEQISLVTCNGVHVWRFANFMENLKLMRENPLQCRYYTPGFYTSSAGYK